MCDYERISKLEWEISCLKRRLITRRLQSEDIHPGQPPLLFILKKLGPCNQRDLARELHHSPPTIAVSLKRMERSGLIRRVPDPDDLRYKRIELTSHGIQAAEAAENALHGLYECQFSDFSEEEFLQVLQYFQRIRQNLFQSVQQIEETEGST